MKLFVGEHTHKAKKFNDLPMVCDEPLICHCGITMEAVFE